MSLIYNAAAPVAPVASRADDIAKLIADNARAVIADKADADTMNEKLGELRQEVTSKREKLLSNIASIAQTKSWTPKEVDSALAIAAKKEFNSDAAKKTFATLASEIKLVADADVRHQFSHLAFLRDQVWGEESERVKDEKKAGIEQPNAPLKLAFARAYHLLIQMCKRTSDPEKGAIVTRFLTRDDVLAFAAERDPRRDPEKVARKLKTMCDAVKEFHANFPLDCIKAAADYLDNITKEHIVAGMVERDRVLAEEAAKLDALRDEILEDLDRDEEENVPTVARSTDPVDELLSIAA